MTFKDLINQVLIRLREDQITGNWDGDINSSALTSYQKLIGALVNDSKAMVESKHDWIALRDDITLNVTNAGLSYFEFGGIGENTRFLDLINMTTGTRLAQVPRKDLHDSRYPTEDPRGEPTKYSLRGINTLDGDMKIDFSPTSDKAYSFKFYVIRPQDSLSGYTDFLKTPSQPVILGAWARAIAERGEDGGTQSGVVMQEANDALNQAIILDHGNTEYESDWYV